MTRQLLAHGELVVVETDTDAYLGTAEVVNGTFVIRSGLRGHPVLLPLDEVTGLTPATLHEDVES